MRQKSIRADRDPDITPPSTKVSQLDQERFRFGVRRASPLSICFPFSKFNGPTEKPIERAKGQRCRCAFLVGADQKTNRKRRCSPHSKSKTLLSKRKTLGVYLSCRAQKIGL